MSEHAGPLSFRLGVAGFASGIIVAYLVTDAGVNTGIFIVSTTFAMIVWALSYFAIYVTEQYLYETGKITRPYTINGEPHPVDEMKEAYAEIVEDKPLTEEHEIDENLFGLLILLAQCIFWNNMDKISRRQLENYAIISDRTGPDAILLMRYLISEELVDDIGNSTYAVTDRLKERLTEITGVRTND